jgi:hypothetical protein
MKSDSFGELRVEIKNRFTMLLFRPVLAESDGMVDKDRMGIAKHGEDGVVAVVVTLDSVGGDRVDREHGGVVKSTDNTVLPFETIARLERREIIIENKTDSTTVTTFGEKFVRYDVDSSGIVVAGEEFLP